MRLVTAAGCACVLGAGGTAFGAITGDFGFVDPGATTSDETFVDGLDALTVTLTTSIPHSPDGARAEIAPPTGPADADVTISFSEPIVAFEVEIIDLDENSLQSETLSNFGPFPPDVLSSGLTLSSGVVSSLTSNTTETIGWSSLPNVTSLSFRINDIVALDGSGPGVVLLGSFSATLVPGAPPAALVMGAAPLVLRRRRRPA